jgi:hypothetical protein
VKAMCIPSAGVETASGQIGYTDMNRESHGVERIQERACIHSTSRGSLTALPFSACCQLSSAVCNRESQDKSVDYGKNSALCSTHYLTISLDDNFENYGLKVTAQ